MKRERSTGPRTENLNGLDRNDFCDFEKPCKCVGLEEVYRSKNRLRARLGFVKPIRNKTEKVTEFDQK